MRYCAEQGCRNLISHGRYCEGHKRKQKKHVVYSKNKSFYRTQAWQDLRAYVYQRDKGCCQNCGKFVFGKQAHCDHIIPIWKDPSKKLDPDNVRLLCPKCHTLLEYKENEKETFDWNLK